MREFFRGWRRKLGVVTLVVACVFAAGWVRSTIIADEFDYSFNHTSSRIIALLDGHIVWMIFDHVRPTNVPAIGFYFNEPFQTFDKFYHDKSKTWKWRFCGIAVGRAENSGKSEITIFVVSFWSIVIPLTLLSAFLLLSKPRQSNQKKITETGQVEGT